MSLRESNTTKLEQQKPDMFKTDAEKLQDDVQDAGDHIASYLPGQSKTRDHIDSNAANPHHNSHDTGRGGLGTMGDALKPSGEQTLGEKVKVEGDKVGSQARPNEHKSAAQNFKDVITPGNDSSFTQHNHTTASNAPPGGEKQGMMEKLAEVKDKVVGAVTGGNGGNHDSNSARAVRRG